MNADRHKLPWALSLFWALLRGAFNAPGMIPVAMKEYGARIELLRSRASEWVAVEVDDGGSVGKTIHDIGWIAMPDAIEISVRLV